MTEEQVIASDDIADASEVLGPPDVDESVPDPLPEPDVAEKLRLARREQSLRSSQQVDTASYQAALQDLSDSELQALIERHEQDVAEGERSA